jgi:hypothetical protein
MIEPPPVDVQRLLRLRLVGASARLDAACSSTDQVVVNAAVADWLDAVYAAQEPYWKLNQSLVTDSREQDVGGARVVGGLVHARNLSTHEWVATTAIEDVYDSRYRPHYGGWCWLPVHGEGDRGADPQSIGEYYTHYLAERLVTECFEPTISFLTDFLPAHAAT